MKEKNTLKGKNKEQIEQVLITDLKELGKQSFDINISPQAKSIISNYGENFPFEKFKSWFIKSKMNVTGGHLHEYLSSQFEKDIELVK